MQNCQLVPQTGNLEAGSGLYSTPQLCVCRVPGALQACRWEETTAGPCPEPRAVHTLDLALPLARHALYVRRARRLGLRDPCPRQGPWVVVGAVPRSQEAASPAAEATDEESSFSKQEVQPLEASQCMRAGGGNSAKASQAVSHLMQFRADAAPEPLSFSLSFPF